MTLDVFGLKIIDVREMVSCPRLSVQKFIQFRLYGLGIPMLCSLDKKRHEPGRHSCDGVPIERIAFEYCPRNTVDADYGECQRMGSEDTSLCQPMSDGVHGDTLKCSKA